MWKKRGWKNSFTDLWRFPRLRVKRLRVEKPNFSRRGLKQINQEIDGRCKTRWTHAFSRVLRFLRRKPSTRTRRQPTTRQTRNNDNSVYFDFITLLLIVSSNFIFSTISVVSFPRFSFPLFHPFPHSPPMTANSIPAIFLLPLPFYGDNPAMLKNSFAATEFWRLIGFSDSFLCVEYAFLLLSFIIVERSLNGS